MYYYEVAPNQIVRAGSDTFTYSWDSPLPLGTVVEIEIGRKSSIGIVLSTTTKPTYSTKSLLSVVESTPLPTHLLALAEWMSDYYATPLATVLQTILPRGLTKARRAKKSNHKQPLRQRINNVFTPDQQRAIKAIKDMSSGSLLLHGVTGSGKTRVYVEVAKACMSGGRSVIIIVPEIALTSQLVADFQHDFDDILLTHSRQTEAERHRTWRDVLMSTRPRIIIGPRSALFSPLTEVGLVIIDECHEPSLKQEQSPRYDAVRTAQALIDFSDAKLIMGSATPLIADYYHAVTSKSPIITMSKPAVADRVAPMVAVIDMTRRDNFNRHYFLSDTLLSGIDRSIEGGTQVLLFHNRRGSASTTLCQTCGWYAGCTRCYVPLTLHVDSHLLICHICNSRYPVPTACPICGDASIVHRGIGTKLIEAEIRKLYPNTNIARFDGDASNDETVNHRYQDLYDGKIQIIIGTQVIAKGLDLPRLRTVGVIQADAGMSLPDYSSSERTFQLISQVIGRVGRSSRPTDVVIQTYQPTAPVILDAVAQNYDAFYRRTLALRTKTNFPPFCHLLKLVCSYKTESTAIRNSQHFAETLRSHSYAIEILGPSPAFYERIRDTYRWQLVIKTKSRPELLKVISHLPSAHWQYELDPLSLL